MRNKKCQDPGNLTENGDGHCQLQESSFRECNTAAAASLSPALSTASISACVVGTPKTHRLSTNSRTCFFCNLSKLSTSKSISSVDSGQASSSFVKRVMSRCTRSGLSPGPHERAQPPMTSHQFCFQKSWNQCSQIVRIRQRMLAVVCNQSGSS